MLIARGQQSSVDWANVSGKPSTVAGYGITDAIKSTSALPLFNAAVDPAGASNGWMYYNTANNVHRIYRNGAWTDIITAASTLVNPTISGTATFIGTPKISTTNLQFNFEALSSGGRFNFYSAGTDYGTYFRCGRGDVPLVKVIAETNETANIWGVHHKTTPNLTTDMFAGFTGYFVGLNANQVGSSGIQPANAGKAMYIDFFPLGTGTGVKKWTYIDGKHVWKEYGAKTELYPALSASTFQCDSATIILQNLPVYSDNTAAASLATGQLYRTATGELRVKYSAT